MRDNAAILTLVSESGVKAIDAPLLAADLEAAWRQTSVHSTQEEAWSLLAAHALTSGRAKPDLTVNGARHEGPLYKRFGLAELESGVTLRNNSTDAIDIAVTAHGAPLQPEPAGGNFATLTRGYFSLDGTPVDLSTVGQGDRFVAVLTVVFNDEQRGLVILDDPLPAGFEIDNPNLLQSGEVDKLDWLKLNASPAHKEFRADRFIASIDRSSTTQTRLEFAYVVRAISPGVFAHPAAIVEDMYRPERRARTASGSVEIVGPLR